MGLKTKFDVIIKRFDGGLNTKATPLHVKSDQSPDLQNVMFDDFGSVETRRGRAPFLDTAIGSAVIDGLHSYVRGTGTAEMIAGANGSIWRVSGNTAVTVASSQSQYTAGVPVHFLTFQDQLFISNGGIRPYKYNGTEFIHWGVSSPSAATVAVNSAGTLVGTYQYWITGVNSNSVESVVGTATTTIILATQRAYLTEIPVYATSAGVNTKNIYRNTNAAFSTALLLTNIANATTVYEDNNSDSTLPVTTAPTDKLPPRQFTGMVTIFERVFAFSNTGTVRSTLFYTDVGSPEIFPALNIIKVHEDDGMEIAGLAILSNAVIIAKNDGFGNGKTYLLYLPTATAADWSIQELNTDYGGQAVKAMTNFSNYLMFLNKYGIFDLNEATLGNIGSDALSFNIEPDVALIRDTFLKNSVAITYKNKVWLSVPSGATQTTNNQILQYDFIRGRDLNSRSLGSWSRFDSHDINDFTIHEGELYGGSALGDGKVYKLDTGYNDDSSAIDSSFLTAPISGKKEHTYHTKVWRHLYITVEAVGAWNMELSYINDLDKAAGDSEPVDLSSGGALWGTFKWGEIWGTGLNQKRIRIDLRNSVSKTIQFKFRTNTADQYFKVHEIQVFYNLKGLR